MTLSVCEGNSGFVEIGEERHEVWGRKAMPSALGRCTVSAGIGPLEHLSAAALCQGVRGWVLRADHPDLPIFDGSGKIWQDAFAAISGPYNALVTDSVVLGSKRWTSARGGRLEVEPADEFRLRVEWTAGPYGPETWEGDAPRLQEVLRARTFVDADDWLAARKAGYLKGTDADCGRLFRGRNPSSEALELASQLGIEPTASVWSGGCARMPDECAAHKAMDLAGDIGCWIGYLPKLSIHARDTGHDLHHLLGSALRGSIGEV